jgi:hypothetical protein
MKKLAVVMIMLSLCISSVFAGNAHAVDNDAYSTSIWMPHRYMFSTWEIPTSMSYDAEEGSVTFSGSMNAGVATTGFTCTQSVDVNDFSIEMSFDKLEAPDKLSWIVLALFDRAEITNNVNPYDVYAPFNLGDGYNYLTSPFNGILIMLQPQGNGVFNMLDINAKGIDIETGEYAQDSWVGFDKEGIVSTIKLDSGNYENVKLTITDDGADGLEVNFNDGAWKDENDNPGTIVNFGTDLAAIKTYFADENKEAYFQFVTMYADDTHREIEITVNEMNGKKASDGTQPGYLADKVLQDGQVSVTVHADSMKQFGVYPSIVDSLEVTKFDEEDENYEAVTARAQSAGMELVDYFKIVPKIGEDTMEISAPVTVQYTLPDTYDNYAIYYINSDDEVVSLPEVLGSVENGKATIKVDNATVSKIVILGSNDAEEPDDNNGCGCGGSINGISIIIGVIALAGAVLLLKLNRKENK